MMAGPHITAFSPVAPCIIFTRALASARLVLSESASTNAVTLTLVALVLFSAICPSPDPPNFALRHDHIKPVIVRFARQFIHFLSRIGDADGAHFCVRAQRVERAVVIAAAIAETMAG